MMSRPTLAEMGLSRYEFQLCAIHDLPQKKKKTDSHWAPDPPPRPMLAAGRLIS